MAPVLRLARNLHDDLMRHMRQSDVEEVAFLAATTSTEPEVLEAFDLYRVEPDEFAFQSDFHVRLSDLAKSSVIRWAHERRAALVEAHAHRGPWAAEFSASDLAGLSEWVPHVRWRLGGRPYAALVFAGSSYDGLAWTIPSNVPQAVGGLSVDGDLVEPTRLTLAYPWRRSDR